MASREPTAAELQELGGLTDRYNAALDALQAAAGLTPQEWGAQSPEEYAALARRRETADAFRAMTEAWNALTQHPLTVALPPEEAPPPEPRRPPAALVSPDPFAGRRVAPFASGAPAFGAAAALLRARAWPIDDSGRPVFVHKVQGRHLQGVFHYQIVVPGEPSGGEVTLAHAELARSILRDMGRDTAWLHMLMLAYAAQTQPGEPAVVPRTAIYRALGLDKRTDLTRRERDRRCQEEIDRLRSLGVSTLRLWLASKDLTRELSWHRQAGALWFLTLHEFGQASFEEDGGHVVSRWDDWQLLVRPGEWAGPFLYGDPMRQLGYLAREMFTHLDRRRSPWGLDFAVYLAFEGRLQPAPRVRVRNHDLIEFAGGDVQPATSEGRRETLTRFLSGVEDQRAWGARPDYGEWPGALRPDLDADRADRLTLAGSDGTDATPRRMPRGYWADFVNAWTAFAMPDDLAHWNGQAAGAKPLASGTSRPRLRAHRPALTDGDDARQEPVTAAELREARRRRGATRDEMARYLGVSGALVSYMETGRRRISPAVADRIRALRMPADGPATGLPGCYEKH